MQQQAAMSVTAVTSKASQAAWDRQRSKGQHKARNTPLVQGGQPPLYGSLAPPTASAQPEVIQLMIDLNLTEAPEM